MASHPARTLLVAYRLAGLSALGADYAGVKWRAMRGGRARSPLASKARLARRNAEPLANPEVGVLATFPSAPA